MERFKEDLKEKKLLKMHSTDNLNIQGVSREQMEALADIERFEYNENSKW